MLPDLWGKDLWTSIHYIALGYPKIPTKEQVYNYKEFYMNLWKVIPCYKCSVNYKKNIITIPIDEYLSSNIKLFEWTVNLHNLVNNELGKPIISLNKAIKIYDSNEKNNKKYSINTLYLIISILIIIILILLLIILISKKYYKK